MSRSYEDVMNNGVKENKTPLGSYTAVQRQEKLMRKQHVAWREVENWMADTRMAYRSMIASAVAGLSFLLGIPVVSVWCWLGIHEHESRGGLTTGLIFFFVIFGGALLATAVGTGGAWAESRTKLRRARHAWEDVMEETT